MGDQVSMAARRRGQSLHQLHVNLWIMDLHKGQSNKSPTSKVLMDKAVDGFHIFESPQQVRKAARLIIQRKHHLMNGRQSRTTCISQQSGLTNSILEHSQCPSLRSISPKIICNRVGMRLSRIQMRINPTSLNIVIKAHICVQQRGDQQEPIRRKHIKDRKYLHFIDMSQTYL
jgi:hypothetical protein